MEKGNIIVKDADIKKMLQEHKTIAVLGLSPKPERDSHKVARYMQDAGYSIIPVRPGQKEILGEPVFKNLDELAGPVDIVDAFRNSEQILSHVPEVIRLKPRVFWMQLGIENAEAAKQLTEAGIDVVMDRCIKVEHDRLIKKNILV